jgi:molybdopterin-guanine dinucleotide biosynthesis protein A
MSSVRSVPAPALVSAAILAGGGATRFGGVDKSALVVDGARILDRQLAALAPVATEILVVGRPPGGVPPAAGDRLPVIPDAVVGAGPIGGLYTALRAARHPWVIVVACDMPFVTTALFERLRDAAGEDVDAVVPRSPRGLEPLCAIYARQIAPLLDERIARGERQLQALAAALRVRELAADRLPPDDEGNWWFENVNTPHDYARAREVKER